MVSVPMNISAVAEFQDNRGFRSTAKLRWYNGVLDSSSGVNFANWTVNTLYTYLFSGATSVLGALAAMSNAKVVKQALTIDLNYAQEPTGETGEYQLVQDKAHLEFGDGNGGFFSIEVPAPKDALFLTTSQDNLIVVNPASTLLTAFQTATAQTVAQAAVGAQTEGPLLTPRGGTWGSQFFGGQYVGKKSRRRRVLQGQ